MAEKADETLLAEVKQALRISSSAFDLEIQTLIAACKIDLRKAGVTAQDDSDPMIKRAIILYAKANFGYDNPDADKFQKAYDLLAMSLALVSDYNGGGGGNG